MSTDNNAMLDIATLPLADGRYVAIPLLALAEVQQLPEAGEEDTGLGTLHWRGHDLPVGSLDEFCGLPGQPREKHLTVGILRGGRDSREPFRALAFCGLAAHQRIKASEMNPLDKPADGPFRAAAQVGGKTFLIPDLPGLLYGEKSGAA